VAEEGEITEEVEGSASSTMIRVQVLVVLVAKGIKVLLVAKGMPIMVALGTVRLATTTTINAMVLAEVFKVISTTLKAII
jgi:hypothetical protein